MAKTKRKHRFVTGYRHEGGSISSRSGGNWERIFTWPLTEYQARAEKKKLRGTGAVVFELVEVPNGKNQG